MRRPLLQTAEGVAFRLTLAVATAGMLGFGIAGLVQHIRFGIADEQLQWYIREYGGERENDPSIRASFRRDWLATGVRRRDLERSRQRHLILAVVVPLGGLAAFYIGRWILAGRFTPVWPLRPPIATSAPDSMT